MVKKGHLKKKGISGINYILKSFDIEKVSDHFYPLKFLNGTVITRLFKCETCGPGIMC